MGVSLGLVVGVDVTSGLGVAEGFGVLEGLEVLLPLWLLEEELPPPELLALVSSTRPVVEWRRPLSSTLMMSSSLGSRSSL